MYFPTSWYQGGVVCLAGVVIGLTLALAAGRALEPLLFGVQSRDPATFAAVAAVLLLVGLLASWLPARRATRISPTLALRAE